MTEAIYFPTKERLLTLPYTICFCVCHGHVLMIKRAKKPNLGLYNGLGGKIELGETPTGGVMREMLEEAELDLELARTVRFAGIVSWNMPEQLVSGMYAFLAYFDDPRLFQQLHNKETREGLLSLIPQTVFAQRSQEYPIVDNIYHFLPLMMESENPYIYHFEYEGHTIHHWYTHILPENIVQTITR